MLPGMFAVVDLLQNKVIDDIFIERVRTASVAHSRESVLVGGTSTSLEPAGTSVEYRLLDGNDVYRYIPELTILYESELVRIASRLSDISLCKSPDRVNGVNVNVLNASGGRYEWHVDSNPVTGLLVLSECNAAIGGRLLFRKDPDYQTAFCMRPGHFLVFDATKTPHAVEQVLGEEPRVTAPMNFFVKGATALRPADLDESLYGS